MYVGQKHLSTTNVYNILERRTILTTHCTRHNKTQISSADAFVRKHLRHCHEPFECTQGLLERRNRCR